LLGLRWDDLDLDAGTLHVRRTLTDVQAFAPVISEPKTARSRRRLPLSAPAVAALRRQRAAQNVARLKLGEAYGRRNRGNREGGGFVFATATGPPVSPDDLHHHWRRACARVGLRQGVHLHDLRHAAATGMLAAGIDVATVSAILGHSSPAITLRVYS